MGLHLRCAAGLRCINKRSILARISSGRSIPVNSRMVTSLAYKKHRAFPPDGTRGITVGRRYFALLAGYRASAELRGSSVNRCPADRLYNVYTAGRGFAAHPKPCPRECKYEHQEPDQAVHARLRCGGRHRGLKLDNKVLARCGPDESDGGRSLDFSVLRDRSPVCVGEKGRGTVIIRQENRLQLTAGAIGRDL